MEFERDGLKVRFESLLDCRRAGSVFYKISKLRWLHFNPLANPNNKSHTRGIPVEFRSAIGSTLLNRPTRGVLEPFKLPFRPQILVDRQGQTVQIQGHRNMKTKRLLTSCTGFVLIASAAMSVLADDLVLRFPADEPVGMVTVADAPEELGTQRYYGRYPVPIGKALGKVVVQSDEFVGVHIGPAHLNDLKWLESLPANALQSLQFKDVAISQDMLKRIATQSGLILLEFKGCQFEPNCFQDISSLPQLRQLRIESSSVPKSGYAQWAARLPQLRNLFASPRPTLLDLEALADHPTLAWTTISIEAEANKTLEALGRLPALRDLTVIIPHDAKPLDPVEPNLFAGLSHLESFGWFYGTLDGKALKAIGSGQKLQKLRLLQVKVGDDFLAGLATMHSLNELSLIDMDTGPFTTDQLIKTLSSLPNLKKWPKLWGVSSSGLHRIVQAQQLEELTIAGTMNVPLTELKAIGELQNISHLELHYVNIDDDWLQCLSGLQQLEFLNLYYTAVVGHGVENLSGLMELQRLHITYGYIDDRKPTPSLTALQHLPSLKHLQIGSHFSPKDLLPLSDLEQLRSLRLWGDGFSDDSTAELIGELKSLTKLTLGDNCVISDKGAEALANLPQLEQLAVGGFLTKAGVERLALMPSIKRLSVATSLLSEQEKEDLMNRIKIPSFRLKSYSGDQVLYKDGVMRLLDVSLKGSFKGIDGLLRKESGTEAGRTQLDALEGLAATEIADFPADASIDLQSLKGKVVLVEFWGTWCGPCRLLAPQLKDLYEAQHENGFEILGVHTATQSEKMSEYLAEKEIRWPNIVDEKSSIAKAFSIPHYPSLFLIDRKGMLRVALAHPGGLADAVESLLNEE